MPQMMVRQIYFAFLMLSEHSVLYVPGQMTARFMLYLRRAKKTNCFQVLHDLSILRINAFKKVHFLLKNLRLCVYHTHYASL